MTDAEVEKNLDYLLATTLTLDDGTRLKPIFIEWDTLTPVQRSRTVQRIKEVTIEELKQLGDDERLRLEFNQIPEELDAALSGLASPDEPSFEWVQIEA